MQIYSHDYLRQLELIDWKQPISDDPLNRELISAWFAIPNRLGWGSSTWRDACGRNHGSLVTPPTWAHSENEGPSRWGNLAFTATSSTYILARNDKTVGDQTDFAISVWYKTSLSDALYAERASTGNDICKLEIGSGKPKFVYRNDSGSLKQPTVTNTTTDGRWHHFLVTANVNNVFLYSDWSDRYTDTLPARTFTNSGIETRIGSDKADGSQYFDGRIASVQVWKRTLSPAEVFAVWLEGRTWYPRTLRRRPRKLYFIPSGGYTLTAEAASYTVTGTDASLEQGYSVSAESATYTVTGTDASLEQGYSVPAESASYSVTGTDASLEQGYAIAADAATYTVTGTDVTLLQGYVIAADAASYTVTGTDVTLTVGAGGTFTLTADSASYTVTGTDSGLEHGYVLTAYNTASAGFVATSSQYYTGTTIAFGTSDFAFACWIYLNDTTGVKTIVSLGSVTNDIEHLWLTVSGTSLFLSLNDSVQATRLTWTFGAGFSTGWNHIVVNFDRSGNATCWINGGAPTAPTVDISGHAAALNPTTFYVGRKVAGSDYFDGRIDKLIYTNAILDSSEIAELSAGAKLSNFSSGLSAKTVYGWEMEAVDGGTQTSAFTSNDLVPTNTPTQEEGYSTGGGSLFAITGTAASLEQGYSIAVDAASYTVTGTDATVEWNRVLSVDSATFTVSGTDVTLSYSGSVGFSLTAEGTQIVLNASNATLTYSALLNEFPELDFSTDYLIMDFPESVTYISKSQYGDTRYTVAKAIQAQPSHQERATSGGTYAGYDLTWLLPGVLMNTTPKISDVILDDAGTEWTIINAQYDQMDRMWNMQTVNLALFFDLRDQIWLYKPDTASTLVDAAGRYTPTFTPAATLIPARIQEQRGDFSEERGKRGTQRTYQIFILEPITDITTEWYAQDTSGNKYDITGWTNKATITDLMTLEAVKRV